MFKTCANPACGQTKPITEFYKRTNKCKECHKKIVRDNEKKRNMKIVSEIKTDLEKTKKCVIELQKSGKELDIGGKIDELITKLENYNITLAA